MIDPPNGRAGGLLTVEETFEENVRGRPLRVSIRRARGSGPPRTPLLMINGIGSAIEVLQPLVDQIPADVEVIRFDPPGIGGSPAPVVPYHMTTFAPLLGQLMRRLGHERVDVLGYSWGGGLAQQFALSQAHQCRRLVLVSTGTGTIMVPGKPQVLLKLISPRHHRDPEHVRRIAGDIYGGTMRARPERATEVLQAGPRSQERGYYYQLLAGLGWTTLPVLGMIRQPTLILAGDDDPIIPKINARILQLGIPHARTHFYRGGHLALLSEPATLAPVIDAFLSG